MPQKRWFSAAYKKDSLSCKSCGSPFFYYLLMPIFPERNSNITEDAGFEAKHYLARTALYASAIPFSWIRS